MADGEDSMAVALRRRRFTLDEYHRMGETGILGEDDRVELIEGEIIEMTPIGSRHAATVARIHQLFVRCLGDRAGVAEAWLVDLQSSTLEIRREPRGDAYRDIRVPRADETFAPAVFPDLTLTRRDLLG